MSMLHTDETLQAKGNLDGLARYPVAPCMSYLEPVLDMDCISNFLAHMCQPLLRLRSMFQRDVLMYIVKHTRLQSAQRNASY